MQISRANCKLKEGILWEGTEGDIREDIRDTRSNKGEEHIYIIWDIKNTGEDRTDISIKGGYSKIFYSIGMDML